METRTKILAKLNAIQKKVEYMAKGGRNMAQNYRYLSETQIAEVFKPLLEEAGVFFSYSSRITGSQLSPTGKQIVTNVEVGYEFIDIETGESLQGVAAGQGSDPNDKGIYKAITGAIKYIYMKTFVIPTGDDPEDDKGEVRVPRESGKGVAAREASAVPITVGGDDVD